MLPDWIVKALKEDTWRDCYKDDETPFCPYAGKNKYGVPICTIDNVTGVRWHGCIPSNEKFNLSRYED